MRNYWLVAKHEYRRVVFRRAFVLVTLAVPLGIIALIALIILVETMGENRQPVGYVDHAGFLDESRQPVASDANEQVEVRSYADESTALAALENEEIQAFFVFPVEYLDTLATDLYYLEEPPSNDVWREFDDFVRLNLVADIPEEVGRRLLEGSTVTVEDIASNRTFGEDSVGTIILPFAASFFFMIATMSASGYMLGVVADEKENRTMEIIVTSITSRQLIGGKALGLLAAALTQLTIFVVTVVVGIKIAMPYVLVLQQLTVPWTYLGVMALFFFPAYILMAAVMVGIGGAVGELQQGQQAAGLVNIIFLLPLILMPLLFQNPGGPAMIFLTFFPPTAFMTVSLRWGLGTIPWWQLGISWVLLASTTLLMVWAASRIFRAGMLRYGQSLSLRSVITATIER